MAQYVAKKTGNVFRDKYYTQVEFEYRGNTYEVEYANSWLCCVAPAHIQHKDKQAAIDKAIDNPMENPGQDFSKELDKVWEMMGW